MLNDLAKEDASQRAEVKAEGEVSLQGLESLLKPWPDSLRAPLLVRAWYSTGKQHLTELCRVYECV